LRATDRESRRQIDVRPMIVLAALAALTRGSSRADTIETLRDREIDRRGVRPDRLGLVGGGERGAGPGLLLRTPLEVAASPRGHARGADPDRRPRWTAGDRQRMHDVARAQLALPAGRGRGGPRVRDRVRAARIVMRAFVMIAMLLGCAERHVATTRVTTPGEA